jgi:deoxyribodipyrimidine photo-lyase
MPRTAVWFRKDLRVTDNTALLAACREADAGVVGIYVLSTGDFRRHDEAACKVDLILRSLRELAADLAKLNIPLIIKSKSDHADVPGAVAQAVRDHDCAALHANRIYGVNEQADERAVEKKLKGDARFVGHHDECCLAPGEVLTNDGFVSQVYTPFRKAFLERISAKGFPEPQGKPRKRREMIAEPSEVPERAPGFNSEVPPDLWPAGESAATKRLRAFLDDGIDRYADERNRPDLEGTSKLSPYLALGLISARTCLAAGRDANAGTLSQRRKGPSTWISELIWREFYKHILWAYPRVSKHRAFKPKTERITWRQDDDAFEAWCAGQTGYPIVDAAMRQLNQTGWMHNRVRMVTAMFLSKDLFLDWRRGEAYFMQRLIDGDLANNNGGWQWSASTGTDAAPYFRIFNPESQSKRFDPDGTFIRKYVPELAELDAKEIHNPPSLAREQVGYPQPIVDHGTARDRAIAAFKDLND